MTAVVMVISKFHAGDADGVIIITSAVMMVISKFHGGDLDGVIIRLDNYYYDSSHDGHIQVPCGGFGRGHHQVRQLLLRQQS
jgi:hypothetical protein